MVAAGANCDRGRAVVVISDLLSPAATRSHRASILLPALEAVLDDPAERVRVMLPPAIVRIYPVDRGAAAHLAERWLDRTTDEGLHAPELERLAWQLTLTHPSLGIRLLRRMLIAGHEEVKTKAGQLAALLSLRQPHTPPDSSTATAESLLHAALQSTATRKGVAMLLAQLVEELSENSDRGGRTDGPARADQPLLIRLLDDNDGEVRRAALGFAHNLTHPLDRHRNLLTAAASTQAFREHPGSLLHTLSQQAGDLPTEALDLCALAQQQRRDRRRYPNSGSRRCLLRD
jgi:hypothetical protein